ncbi:MAG TPA: hypothetical protein VHE13_13385 [Opitutus sp.]|nr:hypothetical protein [Opitutus sp.]
MIPIPLCRPACRLALAGVLALVLAGCATEIKYTTTTSDGRRLTFRMINGVPEHPSEAGLRTDTPKLDPNPKDKTLIYLLRFFVAKGESLGSVKVEDVSDETPFVLVEDAHPEIKNGEWRGVSRAYKLEDPEMRWVGYLDQSFRVYRFTVTLGDGRTVVLHEGVMIPGFGKAMLRRVLGDEK